MPLTSFFKKKQVTIKAKLVLSMSLFFILMVGTILLTAHNLGAIHQQNAFLENTLLPQADLLRDLEDVFIDVHGEVSAYIGNGDISSRALAMDLLESLKNIETEQSTLEQGDVDYGFKAGEMVASIFDYRIGLYSLIVEKDEGASPFELYTIERTSVIPAMGKLQDNIGEREEFLNDKLSLITADLHAAHESALHGLILCGGLLGIIMLFVGHTVVVSITRPLSKLRKGTERIMQGELTYRIGSTAADELGQLSRSFDLMTEHLDTSLVSIDELNCEIEERKLAERRLEQSEYFSSSLLDSSPNPVLVLLPDTSIKLVNAAFERLTGYSLAEIAGSKAPFPWWPSDVCQKLHERLLKAFKQGTTVHERFFQKKNGEKFWVDVNSARITENGQCKYLVVNWAEVTQRKKIEQALRESEERFSKVFYSSPEVITVASLETGLVIDVNQTTIDVLGYTREEFVGRNMAELHIWINPEDWQKRVARLLEGESLENEEIMLRSKNGEIRTFLASGRIIDLHGDKCFISVLSDVTENKQVEASLRESEEKFRDLFDSTSELIQILTLDGGIVYANNAWTKALEYEPDDLGKVSIWDIVHPEHITEFREIISKLVPGNSVDDIETVLISRNGRLIEVIGDATVTVTNNETVIRCLFRDVTERNQMAREIIAHRDNLGAIVEERTSELTSVNERLQEELEERRKAEAALRSAKDAADDANKAKSEFLARMSHEIRTPIHGIMGTLDLVLDTELASEQRRYLLMSKTSSERLLDVINDVLDFSKIEAGKLELEEIAFDLRQAVEESVDTLAVTAFRKKLEVTVWFHENVPDNVIGDPARLRQVLLNLMGNSIKFTNTGEIAITVDQTSSDQDETELCFSIRDTGIGIRQEKLDLIFDMFQQGDGSVTRLHGGSGLGLTICRQIVSRMGGTIWVESRQNEGSIFHFTVRFKLQHRSRKTENNIKLASGDKALLVCENVTNRSIVKRYLEKWGFYVTDAPDAASAMNKLKKSKSASSYGLLVADHRLMVMGGSGLTETIEGYGDKLGIVVLVTPDTADSFKSLNHFTFHACVTKPVKESILLEAVGVAMGLKPPSQYPLTNLDKPEKTTRSLHILVAEDNPTSQVIARKILEKMGHKVTVVANGLEELHFFKHGEYDVILTDIEMPVMDGIEAVKRIRDSERESGGHVPVFALTAYALGEDRERCLAAGMDGYLSKPVKQVELDAMLNNVVGVNPVPESAGQQNDTSIMDMDSIMEVFGGEMELFRETAELFLQEEYPEQLQQLHAAAISGDTEKVRNIAHSIKGAARSLGAVTLGEIAGQIEEKGRQGLLEDIGGVIEEMEKERERYSTAINTGDYDSREMKAT